MGGEAGVGKTRLADRVRRARRRRPGRPRWSAAASTSRTAGCRSAPFVEALRDHARGLDDAARICWRPAARAGRLLPDLVEPPTGPAPAISASAQGRLFELALGLLGRMAADRPLLLVLEDLHWSDRSTRDLLAFLVRNLRAERIVIVATYRSDELYRGHPLRRSSPSSIAAGGSPARPAPVRPRRARRASRRAPRLAAGARRSSSPSSSARRATRSSPRSL